ncbi:unnamed protein product [Lota lota]
MQHQAMEHQAMEHQAMQHQAMQHQAMEHQAMEHQAMQHQAMEHQAMEHQAMEHQAMQHFEHRSSFNTLSFGRVNIVKLLDESYTIGVRRHDDEVNKNRQILGFRLIDCVKFCGAFESARER